MKLPLAILLFCCSQVTAQSFGLKAGVSYNTMDFHAAGSPTTVKNSWKPGFYLGGSLRVQLNTIFAVQPEYMYKLMKGEEKAIASKYTLHYFSLPLLLRAELNKRLVLLTGPEFGLLIQANKRDNSGVSIDATHDTEERALSAVGGLEVQVASGVFVEARYVHGLNHVGLGQRSVVKEFKWRWVEVGFGVRF